MVKIRNRQPRPRVNLNDRNGVKIITSHKAMRWSEFCAPKGLDKYESSRQYGGLNSWRTRKPQAPSREWLATAERRTYRYIYSVPARPEGRRIDDEQQEPALNGDPLNQKQRDKAQPSVRCKLLWGNDHRKNNKNTLRCEELQKMAVLVSYKEEAGKEATLEEERKNGDRHLVLHTCRCGRAGHAITLPQIEPDTDLDADERTPTTRVDERMRDWLGWPQRCGTVSRGPGGGDFGGQTVSETGWRRCSYGWGAREGAISIG
ncbi:hypothetical protein B0H13DRAFT_1935924 [Mycena leptocephala]|nr:hypothetical protein B0H13DRAFT_1935924 [Mycena leptocephala]